MDGLPTPPGASPMYMMTNHNGTERTNHVAAPPIERLPNELLGDIFTLLRDEPGMKNSLFLVCHYWRLVILQIPQFWSKIVVFPRRVLTSHEAVERLKMLIERSGSMLLEVDWGCLSRSRAALSLQLANCLLERTSVSRWQSLRIGRTGTIPIHKVKGTFSNLRTLMIDHSEEAEALLTLIAASSPKLALLKLPNVGIPSSSEHDFMTGTIGPDTLLRTAVIHRGLNITHISRRLHASSLLHICPLHQLTELIIDRLTSSDMRLGTFCPNLEKLTVRNCVEKCAHLDINLPALRELLFDGPNYYVLCRIDAPKLQTLRIGKPGFNQGNQIQTLPEALDDTLYQLSPTTLHIHCPADIMTITTFIELSPGLRHLEISLYSAKQPWRSIFTSLHRSRTTASQEGQFLGWQLCEYLVSLKIWLHWDRRDVEEVRELAVELLAGRSRGRMRKVTVEWGDGFIVTVDM